jgi:[acyl-carrier-protein] S-malonyltransferase
MNLVTIYPGQGSQKLGMGKFLFDEFKFVQTKFEEASDAIKIDFKKLCFASSEQDLALTKNTQPALLLVSHCYFAVLKENAGLKPTASAGHSVGEYAAMVNENAISLSDGIKSVRLRGELMQSATPPGLGGMVAVLGASDEDIIKICAEMKSKAPKLVLEPANFNSPGQVVLSGHLEAIEFLKKEIGSFTFLSKQPKLIPLKVSAPFHCSLMKPAEEGLAEHFKGVKFSSPNAPIVQNVIALPETKPENLKSNLVKQVSASVRWVECVQALQKFEPSYFLELGVGTVLTGLNKKIAPDVKTLNFETIDGLKEIERLFK